MIAFFLSALKPTPTLRALADIYQIIVLIGWTEKRLFPTSITGE
jgi:hypothetical protein